MQNRKKRQFKTLKVDYCDDAVLHEFRTRVMIRIIQIQPIIAIIVNMIIEISFTAILWKKFIY